MQKLLKFFQNDYIVRGLSNDVSKVMILFRSFGFLPASNNAFLRVIAHLIAFIQISLALLIILIPTIGGVESLVVDPSTFYGFFTVLIHYCK